MRRRFPARLILDPPLAGAVNMARDEALLESCGSIECPITLRFYAWAEPTISLGYFQEYREYEMLPPPAGELAVVRRTTGGGAILHDLEITYSLIVPVDHELVRGRPNELYRLAHQAIIDASGGRGRFFGDGESCGDESAQRGPFFCFARRHGLDVVIDATNGVSKLAGSAQRRSATAILQHGSIMLDSRFPQQSCATWKEAVSEATRDAVPANLTSEFGRVLSLQTESNGQMTDSELRRAAEIESKYSGDEWTRRR